MYYLNVFFFYSHFVKKKKVYLKSKSIKYSTKKKKYYTKLNVNVA